VEAIRFCFDIVAQGTPLEGAALTIEEPEGLGTCRQCGKEVPLERPIALCPCPERARLDITAGEELLIKEMETCVAPAAAATRTR
jgi:hydrogenase nickel incorporation protein HypA/HybF